MIEIKLLYVSGLLYLCLLFLIAHAAEQGWIGERLVRHPWVYTLSLGVYATTWSYYGSVGFAATSGYLFLAIYLGVTLAFLATPFLLQPLYRLSRDRQLTSLADLFAFRFRSQGAGVVVTLFMLLGTLPYIALQIHAVTQSIEILTSASTTLHTSLLFCLTLILFSILFGARHLTPREKHHGLVLAIAFESLIKLLALLLIGGVALFGVFDGPLALQQWLSTHPERLQQLQQPLHQGAWTTLLLLSFAAAFLLPRQFHMTITENFSSRSLRFATWAFPLFLLLLNLPILPLLWAGTYLQLEINPDYYVLGVAMASGTNWLPVLVFIGGISAASAMVIVATLALSNMCLHHLLLPLHYPAPKVNLYRWLLWSRRLLIGLIIFSGYGFYQLLTHHQGLAEIGLISFVAVAQFLPGVVAVLYWRRANRAGFLLGLGAGITLWAVTLLLPLLAAAEVIPSAGAVEQWRLGLGLEKWQFATLLSLSGNMLFFVIGSLWAQTSADEREAARICAGEPGASPQQLVMARSPEAFRQELGQILGAQTADKEVTQALHDLGMDEEEAHPAKLRRLRDRIERNLSGLVGPQLAHIIINRQLELDRVTKMALADSMRYIEQQMKESRSRLDDLVTSLDRLRRYHHRVLLDLPLGVCAVEEDRRVTLWNPALQRMSGIGCEQVLGEPLRSLPPPWGELLEGLMRAEDVPIHHLEVEVDGQRRWFNLHQAVLLTSAEPDPGGAVMLVEDLTDREHLEAELAHSDRLASLGRLAAGLAHEIGNPITGIDSLAQNLRHEQDPAVVAESVAAILLQTRRVSGILRSMMNFSRRGESAPPERFPLAELLAEAVALVQLSHRRRQVRCDHFCPPEIELTGQRQQLLQVLVNLLTNAMDASPQDGRVELLAINEERQIRLEVIDYGEGIAPERLELVCEPFYTTKQVGEGTGLGLALAHSIVTAHGGKIEIDSQPGVGTRLVVILPLAAGDTRE